MSLLCTMSRLQNGNEFNLLRTQICKISRALQNMLTGVLIRGDIWISKNLGQFRSLLCEVREPSFILKSQVNSTYKTPEDILEGD
ncbi:hypothetical protein CEXT_411711 [Caerostris extrusa]|uniref:Uncharacterized protein n=1 Tax=Caerostris extrusa TaxID=172846 RepID=A0AAV4S3S9_CAEEX|nr:hypothetical protein CEXT_411711 [Caerostris extrusa]